MCGIAGLLDVRAELSEAALHNIASRMASALEHRGPDDAGTWAHAREGVGLGFQRLAVLDLTHAGHQPMLSADGRYVLVFNGEIYNFKDLRTELSGMFYRGHSDTEVMLAAFSRWGVREATRRFNGMFAFALWDRELRSLTLGRDRLGEKPLYYGIVNGQLLFGSELKALRAAPGFSADLDRGAVALYLRHGYVPAPLSIYIGIQKLSPAHLVEISGTVVGTPKPYWSAREAAEQGLQNPFAGGEDDALEQLHRLLLDSVRMRLESDVPFGAFLSGGVDSSLVVALAQSQRPDPLRTFTIGFSEQGYDEAPHAKAVATHLGTSHTELYVTPAEATDVVRLLPTMFDEPFSDSSQIPTFLVSQLARRDVTVCLSGDGGDELFGGYTRYLLLGQLWDRLGRVPLPVRRGVAAGIRRVSPAHWGSVSRMARPLLPDRFTYERPGERLHKFASILGQSRAEDVYLQLVSLWNNPGALVLGGEEPRTSLTDPSAALTTDEPALRAMYLDAVSYLPDDILTKVDRAAMSVGLETRVPLLDHRLYEFAWRLPVSYKIRGGSGKHLLRRVLHKYVPAQLVERPKMGFGVPLDVWLRGPLREWAEDLLGARRLSEQNLLDVAPIRKAWEAHLRGEVDAKYQLWAVLVLQAWLDECSE